MFCQPQTPPAYGGRTIVADRCARISGGASEGKRTGASLSDVGGANSSIRLRNRLLSFWICVTSTPSFCRKARDFSRRSRRTCACSSRAFDEKVESLIVDSHDGANRIQDPHWCKGGQS